MNALLRCFCISCAVFITACATNVARAQRVRFGSGVEDPSYDGGAIALADRSATSLGNYSSIALPASRSSTSEAPIYIVPVSDSSAASLGASLPAPQPTASNWDPYRVAQRSNAVFTGTITSSPGQYLVPQPMPRVPYYTQQPISGAAPVVLPAQPAAAQPVFPTTVQPGPIVPATVPPPVVIPPTPPPVVTTPPFIAPAAVPPPVLPLIKTSSCYAYADAIFFTRDAEIGNQPLVLLDGNAPTQSNVLLSTADLDFPWQVGPRITLGRDFDAFRSFEATYWGIFDWKTTATVNGNNNLNLPGDLGLAAGLDFFNADTMTIDYKSQINDGELTYLQNYGGLAWLIGFRYFGLGEQFSVTSTDNQTGTSFYQINAYNNLFGGQIGARLTQGCGTCTSWSYDITGKAGVYDNVISTAQRVGDFSGFSLRDVKTNASQVAFIGEIDFNTNYALNPTWSIRGGYQVFWVDGLALAPNQLDFSDTAGSGTTVNKTGGLFMHGAHAGLMARW